MDCVRNESTMRVDTVTIMRTIATGPSVELARYQVFAFTAFVPTVPCVGGQTDPPMFAEQGMLSRRLVRSDMDTFNDTLNI